MHNRCSQPTLVILTALMALLIGSRFYYYSPLYNSVTAAIAVIHPTQGSAATGTVTFTQMPRGIMVTADITQLSPGEHGFHIHEYGDCSCKDGTCAGDHFNPAEKEHGGPDDEIRHVGDLGNVMADTAGNAHLQLVDQKITLNGPHSIIGRSVIVHAKRDDLISQPTGDAGARMGCGVIGIKG